MRISSHILVQKVSDDELVIVNEITGEEISLIEEEVRRVAAAFTYFFPTTSRRFTSVERAGIRHLAQSPQCGPFVSCSEHGRYVFAQRVVFWPVVRQAARDSREAVNMWRCVTCDRLQPYFLKRCKACKGAA